MNRRLDSKPHRAAIDSDAVRRVELQVQSVLAAAGAVLGAVATVLAATYLGIGSEVVFTLGLLAIGVGTTMGVASAPQVAAALHQRRG